MAQVLVDDLIAEVRSMLDEDNTASVSDELDILPALNRAMRHAASILSRQYESPLLANANVTPVNNQFPMPVDCFEERVEKVEVLYSGQYLEVKRISFREVSIWDSTTQTTDFPLFYYIKGRTVVLLPASGNNYPHRVWYIKEPAKLQKSQGLVTAVSTSSGYLDLDDVGDLLTDASDSKNSYISVFNNLTGSLIGSYQIQTIINDRVYIRPSPVRSSVLGLTVDGTLSSDIGIDCVVCVCGGTAVPILTSPVVNFLQEFAVFDINRKLGLSGDTGIEQQILQKFEKMVESTWVGREQHLRVRAKNPYWNRNGFKSRRK